MFDEFVIPSPKRISSREPFDRLYPYYAGFPASFVRSMLSSSIIGPTALIYDPWNGSGTTTFVASSNGLPAIGYDLNPVMAIVAKARLLPASEASSLIPLSREILRQASLLDNQLEAKDDPLAVWFKPSCARHIRAIERACAAILLDATAKNNIDLMSRIAAAFYAALFSTCRALTREFRSSNPTWLRQPKHKTERVSFSTKEINDRFYLAVNSLRELLVGSPAQPFPHLACEIKVADATKTTPPQRVDCVLTSPPYCTRIDYATATRLELSLIHPLLNVDAGELRSRMIGTTKMPTQILEPITEWGPKCTTFLEAVRNHPSKASKGYYYGCSL
jgi:hypothetical protein